MIISHKIKAVMLSAVFAAAVPLQSAASGAQDNAPVNVASVRMRANSGDADAMNQLGVWYYSGQNVTKDIPQAVELWRRAARQGNAKSIANLGICYQYGTGLERDSLAAMRLYVSAIDAGHVVLLEQRKANVGTRAFDGMLVGLCYEKGIGTPRDLGEAAQAYAASAALGSADAAAAAARCMLASGNASGASDYAIKAADAGNTEGCALAGAMLVDGKGVAPSVGRGVGYLLKAAPYDAGAACRLAALVLAGAPEATPYTRQAMQYLAQAAARGNSGAMLEYAHAYRDGTGVTRDYDRAVHWLDLASVHGDAGAISRFEATSPETFRTYRQAVELAGKGRFDQADKMLKGLERKKITEASVMRAALLANPANPDADVALATKQLRKLSGKNHQAATLLAKIYRDSNPRNDQMMRALLLRAATDGYGPAAAVLADIYYTGDGVTADHARAAEYYAIALAGHDLTPEATSRYATLPR